MKTLEIKSNSIKVEGYNGQPLLVARYEDENGIYFLNENMEKQYAVIENKEKNKNNKYELEEFSFNVEYEHKGMIRGWNQKNTTVKAKNYEEALKKVNSKFKKIYEISEL